MYLYDLKRDDDYLMRLEQENLDEKFNSDAFIINCGQDFEKHYLGNIGIDYNMKNCWKRDENPGKLSDQGVKTLNKGLFDPETPSRVVTMFTPTWASDVNLGKW